MEDTNGSEKAGAESEPAVPSPSVTVSTAALCPPAPVQTRTYWCRWYILAVFSLISCLQCAVWNTFGPITAAALTAFSNWNNTIISSLANMGPLSFVVCVLPCTWLLNRRGARFAVALMVGGVAAGTALRCVSSDQTAFTATAFVGAILNGIGGVTAMAAPPYISEVWFPPDQRTTATGIANIFNQLGNSVSFLIGPLLVHEPGNSTGAAATARGDIMRLMYVEAAAAGALLLAVLVYYPARPPLPPSVSAAAPARDFWHGLRQAVRAPDLPWVVGIYTISGGVQAAWFSVLDINVGQVGVTEDEAGWLGFWAGTCCCLVALVAAWLTDMFRGHMKVTILVLILCGTVCYSWQLAIIAKWVDFSLVQLYCSTLLAISFLYAATPLLYEYGCELCYPVPADVIGAIMAVTFNVTTSIPLLVFLCHYLAEHTLWINYALVVSSLISAGMLLMTTEVYRRTNVDVGEGQTDESSGDPA